MVLWHKLERFPVQFQPLPCLNHHDLTSEVTEMLCKLTPQLQYIFKELERMKEDNSSPRMLQKELADFFISIGVRGILTCLGIRKTNSSVDLELPPERQQLMVAFNRLYTLLSEDQLKNNPNPPMLTVGARAMTKHIQRQSGGYWGDFNGYTEKQRNDYAN